MYRDRRDISDRLHIPDLAEELILGIDMIRILRKERQEIKFLCRELRFLAVDPDAPCRLVNFQTADLDDVVLVQVRPDQPVISGQMRLHARDQLTRRKRLRDVIVCAKPEPANLVDIVLLCTDHEDRCVSGFADLTADLETVHPGQHQVQYVEVIVLGERLCKTLAPVCLYIDLKARELQIVLLQARAF